MTRTSPSHRVANGSTGPRPGLSLLEILIVISLIAVLIGLLMAAVARVRGAADRIGCANNLKQFGLALTHYHDSHGAFPQGSIELTPTGKDEPEITWMVRLLPYLDQEPLWKTTQEALKTPQHVYYNPPHVGLSTPIKPFVCPSDPRLFQPLTNKDGLIAAYTDYIGIAGGTDHDGVMGFNPGISIKEITDGTGNTIIVSERPPPVTLQAGKWYTQRFYSGFYGHTLGPDQAITVRSDAKYPGDFCRSPFYFGVGKLSNACDRYHLWSLHQTGSQFLFADGSVRFLGYSIGDGLIPFATRAKGDAVSSLD